MEFPFQQRPVENGLRNILENLVIVKEVELEFSEDKVKPLKELKVGVFGKLFA
jgi:hypothetical protein